MPDPHTPVSEIGEHGILQLIAPFVAAPSADLIVGFGDDAAIASTISESYEIFTADMLVAGTHFYDDEQTDWHSLGRKAVIANISDAAAMGAQPRFILVSLGLPAHATAERLVALYRGMHETAQKYGASLIGGDTVASPHWVISIALTAHKPAHQPLALRSNCKPGQHVYVSGNLGNSMAGFKILHDEKYELFRDTPHGRVLIHDCLNPEPRLELGKALASSRANLGMIDISDSLFSEVHQLAEASKVGFSIDVARIPASAELRLFCADAGEDILDYVLFSGEEYELLFTIDAIEEEFQKSLQEQNITTPIRRIGLVTGSGKVIFTDQVGKKLQLKDKTFQHFG